VEALDVPAVGVPLSLRAYLIVGARSLADR
jgi:hypothetical protein